MPKGKGRRPQQGNWVVGSGGRTRSAAAGANPQPLRPGSPACCYPLSATTPPPESSPPQERPASRDEFSRTGETSRYRYVRCPQSLARTRTPRRWRKPEDMEAAANKRGITRTIQQQAGNPAPREAPVIVKRGQQTGGARRHAPLSLKAAQQHMALLPVPRTAMPVKPQNQRTSTPEPKT